MAGGQNLAAARSFAPGRHLIALPLRPDEPARRRIFPAHPILVVIEIALARLRFTSQSVKKNTFIFPRGRIMTPG